VVVGRWPDVQTTQVFVLMSVRNINADSIAENYKLHIEDSDLAVSITPTPLPTNYPVSPSEAQSKVTFDQQGSLVEKTTEPIKSGAKVQGWLRFVMELPEATPEFIGRPGVKYTITLTDVSGNVCTAEHVMQGDRR
jgi:hypothetical protein